MNISYLSTLTIVSILSLGTVAACSNPLLELPLLIQVQKCKPTLALGKIPVLVKPTLVIRISKSRIFPS